jgi:multicomponent Na+:H+ antiporter subunit G
MNGIEWLTLSLAVLGAVFFLAGTAGLLRFPDIFTRLHALTKADNVGLGLVAAAVAVQSGSWFTALKLLLIWLLVMVSSSTVCHLVARRALRDGTQPWRQEP